MDTSAIKEAIVTKVYHLTSETKVPLHKHDDKDEIFYCVKGAGFGVLEDKETELTAGKAFIVPAGTMHSLRSEGELYVSSFLVPVVDERLK
ncbi:MAG: cupin domain-containing protein [Candidatus Omnitrophica bacterium]|nr:cupin domain-containing protein [Candidatus Omnitrophota bacterium]